VNNLIIERLNGTQYNSKDYGVIVEDFIIHSPDPRTPTEVFDGRPGYLDMGTEYEGRRLTAKLGLIADDAADYLRLRNEWFRILDSREFFYLIDERESWRRWLVKAESFTPDKVLRHAAKFPVNFTSPSPYAESIGTTIYPKGDVITQATTNYGDPPVQYAFNSVSNFKVWNDGDVQINPRHHELRIAFKGASTNLKIKNTTTNEEWQYTGTTNNSDTIFLDGVRATKNLLSIFGSTNKKLVTLVPGFNDFVITGASGSFSISFDFRFLYM
jgi:Phage tail protein